MRSITQPIFFFPLLMLLLPIITVPAISGSNCEQDEQSSLLQLKDSLVIETAKFVLYPGSPSKIATWNSTSDCCIWSAVTCSDDGHVIGLDLSNQSISGGFDNTSSPLFDLQHLQLLNLSHNYFNNSHIPPGIGKLVNLLHLDLSFSNFGGPVPLEISTLTSLLTLNLSSFYDYHSPTTPILNVKLSALVRNLTRLTHLNLDYVDLSAEAEADQWCHALSSSLPSLQVLTLSDCFLLGPLHSSLLSLQALYVIDLSFNNLSMAVPDFLAQFPNLTSLRLARCELYGNFPQKILQVASIQALDLWGNELLSGTLPDTMGNLKMLSRLDLSFCSFNGSISNIPWENFHDLVHLDLRNNAFSRNIPLSLFSLPLLKELYLSNNQFSGEVGEFSMASSSSSALKTLYLQRNKLEGSIPTSSFLKLESLEWLDVSYNNFSGQIHINNLLQSLSNLTYIDLSFNSLSILESDASTATFPQFDSIFLASCNIKSFPNFLRNQTVLQNLDLSENQIDGEIPRWIWELGLFHLNLSHNSLIGFEGPFPNHTSLSSIIYLDLNSNQLQGEMPIPPFCAYLDLSFNNFNSVIPYDVGQFFFLSLASNNFHGSIPPSICNSTEKYEIVIDFSNNSLSGNIPPCLIEMTGEIELAVLNVRRNKLTGTIPDAFQDSCAIETLDLSENQIQGKIPESVVKCKRLEILHLGNNEMNGSFPCWLVEMSDLKILILRSNKFGRFVTCPGINATTRWPQLQIIDISANNFGGVIPSESFKAWTAGNDQYKFENELGYGVYYQDTVTITSKGNGMELVKIRKIHTSVDLSNNNFEGPIPESIGNLKKLFSLNLSHNRLSGQIPSSFGNMRELESLDLANNSLSGNIPAQLANLNFLSFLNLSYNQLEGKIPTGTQLQTFSELSYTRNKGLCGPPLEVKCMSTNVPVDPTSPNAGNQTDGMLVGAAFGYVVGLGGVIGSLLFLKNWRLRYFARVDWLLFRIFPLLNPRTENQRRRRRRNQRHRQ